MKPPVEVVKGRIVGYDPKSQELLIRARYDDWYTMTKREFKTCLVQPLDSRPLSDKQRRACYAMLHEISDYTGQNLQQTKELLKLQFLAEQAEMTAESIFSLSNASMSLVCGFQRYLVNFIIDFDIPCSKPLLNFVDDIPDYVYACIVHKKCCICGRPSDLHHTDAIGMGRDRTEIIHEGMMVLPLCREHHREAHTIGQQSFESKYHIIHGIEADKTICKLYNLKRKGGKRQ